MNVKQDIRVQDNVYLRLGQLGHRAHEGRAVPGRRKVRGAAGAYSAPSFFPFSSPSGCSSKSLRYCSFARRRNAPRSATGGGAWPSLTDNRKMRLSISAMSAVTEMSSL